MPAYDFKCTACGDIFEITRPAGETAPVTCPACESPAKKVFSPVGVHFKGSGFYNTDRRTGPTPAAVALPAAAAATPACPAATGGTCAGCPAAASE